MSKGSSAGQDDPYALPNGVLANKLGITSTARLNAVEGQFSAFREAQLIDKPIKGGFDLEHLNRIHKHLFQDVYSWAGQPRTVDIAKGGDQFGHHAQIENYTTKLLAGLARENYLRETNPQQFAERAGHYMGELLAVHPYREGNGRSTRAFINEVARESGRWIEWNAVGRQAMTSASRLAFDGDSGALSKLIALNLRSLDEGASIGLRQQTPSVNASISLFKEARALMATGETESATKLLSTAYALASDIGRSGRYAANPFSDKNTPELREQFERGLQQASHSKDIGKQQDGPDF